MYRDTSPYDEWSLYKEIGTGLKVMVQCDQMLELKVAQRNVPKNF